jgi:D-tyrosyl-tRNA(Tyr) deacylase
LLAVSPGGTLPDVKALVQRVARAAVHIDGECVGSIPDGLCVFIGVGHDDEPGDAELLGDRLLGLRIFEDDAGKMNLSLRETGGAMLVVSQFTLLGDTRRGRRPSFVAAARPEQAEPIITRLVEAVRAQGIEVATGRFGADMQIDLCNDGPVTLMLDTREKRSA